MRNLMMGSVTGLLLYLGWPTSPFTYLLFVAFIPLLFAEKNIRESDSRRKYLKVFLLAWFTFAIFNVTGTWWVRNAHWSGTVATTFFNGLFMATVFLIYTIAAKNLGERRARFALPFVWISLEVLHLHWDLSFPWLNLGHGLASRTEWIQWYEFTGHLGGTLWIWVVNLVVFSILENLNRYKSKVAALVMSMGRLLFWFFIPVALSLYLFHSHEEKGEEVHVVVVQPNIDSNTEKFALPENEQLEKFARLAMPYLHDSVDYLVGPETMLVQGMDEDRVSDYSSVNYLRSLIRPYPNLNLITGAVTYRTFNEPTPISRPFGNSGLWYEIYNTSFQLNRFDSIPLYHKSKLVVGAEIMPFTEVIKPLLGDVVVNLGGIVGTHGTQENREVFVSSDNRFRVGTSICWEAEFGSFMTGFPRNGANLIFAITNDGWWGDTDGHRQHMHYARLRAIESRRAIARSANTGISCLINQRGDVLQKLDWAQDGALSGTLRANKEQTFYVQRGDIIGRVALFITFFLLIYTFVRSRIRRATERDSA